MKAPKTFPKTLFVRREDDGDNSYLLCEEKEYNVVEDGVTTEYGVYQLVSTRKARKVNLIEFVE